jgi:hypothetical protein
VTLDGIRATRSSVTQGVGILDGNAQPTGTFLHARLVHAD